ncbi:putative lipoprotein YbbD precursor [compost metagenome]
MILYLYMNHHSRSFIYFLSISLLCLLFPALSLAQNRNLQYYIDKKIESLTLDQKIGQLFIVGFADRSLTPELQSFIQTYKPGSFILFKRNISSLKQIQNLNQSLYQESFKITSLPPLLAVDQEGGSVSRLPIDPPPPNALALGQTQSPLLVEEIGYQTALFLREVGFNMNLAPVLDVVDIFSPGFIGVRSFGSDPHRVGDMGIAFSKGLLKAKVLPTAKHFPGTGNITADPHKSVVINNSSKEKLITNDILPFNQFSKIKLPTAVMMSHLVYPQLDSSREPASFSSHIIHNILRRELNYKGIVVTDDLQMNGSKLLLKPEEAALKSLKAGSDMVMLTWSFSDQAKAFARVKKAILAGEIPEKDLHDKLERILMAKAMTHSYKTPSGDLTVIKNQKLSSTRYYNLEEEVLQSNLREHLLPRALPSALGSRRIASTATPPKLCVISPSRHFLSSFSEGYKAPFSSRLIQASINKETIESWVRNQSCKSIVLTVVGPSTSAAATKLSKDIKKNTVIVNLGAPRLVRSEKGYLRVIQLYFSHREAGKKIAQHLDEILKDSSSSYAIK